VELDLIPADFPDAAVMDYLRKNSDITDVILHLPDVGKSSLVSQLDRIGAAIDQLGRVEHIACIRLRCQAFQTRPDGFTPTMIDQLAGWARFSLGDPLKIEMETWWMLPEDLLPEHGWLAEQLAGRGIQTYANLALISGVNDDPVSVCKMAQGLRRAGIDFHHCYVAGLAVQNQFNLAHPIETDQVLAIASHVRATCSGREIPLYMIQTPLGEVDFGLTSKLVRPPETDQETPHETQGWFLQLTPYDAAYFTALNGGKNLTETEGRQAADGLMVPLSGLVRSGYFAL
jgi:L-lysine 2,3-aminomutase